ncbi:MAG: hypothetical protein ACT4OE_05265 [Sphingosinicella sp.]
MKIRLLLIALAATAPTPLFAQARASERPEVLTRIIACREIGDERQRLACFDAQVAALQAAEANREIAVVDREQVRRTRRSLFGLAIPDLGIFGGDDDDEESEEEGFNQINSRVGSSYVGPDGRLVLVLEEGGTWVQTDGRRTRARTGEAIRIRRGILGSFIANVEERPGVRVVRVR